MKFRFVLAVSALAGLAACGRHEGFDVSATGPGDPGAGSAQPAPAVTPAIIPPDEVADPQEPPSYEVAIASAAANRNTALARCATQPSAVRTECEQEANAAFSEAETKLQDLRGNKE